jgi:hypothetical protein
VTEFGLRQLQARIQGERLQERIDQELKEGEALVGADELAYWDQLSLLGTRA